MVCCALFQFFCFKQKTAYEMRISDWSSDVCSSDLDGTRSIRGPLKAALNSGKLITEGADFSARDIQDIAASLQNASTSLLQRNNNIPVNFEIGRASCRERVRQYV